MENYLTARIQLRYLQRIDTTLISIWGFEQHTTSSAGIAYVPPATQFHAKCLASNDIPLFCWTIVRLVMFAGRVRKARVWCFGVQLMQIQPNSFEQEDRMVEGRNGKVVFVAASLD